jgi:glucokinase
MTALVRRFLAATDLPIGRPTNLTWVLDERGLARDLGLDSVRLITDLEAIGRVL